MSLRQRGPYMALLAALAGLLFVACWDAWLVGDWWKLGICAVFVVLCLAAALSVAVTVPGPAPEWTRRFEVRAATTRPGRTTRPGFGYNLVCNRCDVVVMPFSAGTATLPRILTYAFMHYGNCQLRRDTDPEATGRLTPTNPASPRWNGVHR